MLTSVCALLMGLFVPYGLLVILGIEVAVGSHWGLWYMWSRSITGPKVRVLLVSFGGRDGEFLQKEWSAMTEGMFDWVSTAFDRPAASDIDYPYRRLPLAVALLAVVVPVIASVATQEIPNDCAEATSAALYLGLSLLTLTALVTFVNYTLPSEGYVSANAWPLVPALTYATGMASILYSSWLLSAAASDWAACAAVQSQVLLCGLALFFVALWDVSFKICWSVVALMLLAAGLVCRSACPAVTEMRCCSCCPSQDGLLFAWWKLRADTPTVLERAKTWRASRRANTTANPTVTTAPAASKQQETPTTTTTNPNPAPQQEDTLPPDPVFHPDPDS